MDFAELKAMNVYLGTRRGGLYDPVKGIWIKQPVVF